MNVAELQAELKKTLLKHLPGKSVRVAIIDFPNYLNVGDNAIWLGQIDVLKELNFKIAYVCTVSTYNKSQLSKALGKNGIILLQGGGNFGDLWMRHENLRRNVIHDFLNHPIIQLPQSIHYGKEKELQVTKKLINAHPNFTFLARDKKSFDFAKEHFSSNCFLCPDMAFGMKNFKKRIENPERDVLWLIRRDKEVKIIGFQPKTVGRNEEVADWSSGYHSSLDTICSGLFKIVQKFPNSFIFLRTLLIWVATRTAQKRMDYGIRLLSKGKVVITNRLHGHIICFMLGMPHVAMDNSYGKVSGFMNTWGSDKEDSTYFASDGDEAHAKSETLLKNS